MKELTDRLFPEPDEPNILGGMSDFTYGRATEYFTGLPPQDRTVVQWYLQQRITPYQTLTYAVDLAESYAVVDPERRSKDAIQSAHKEVQRVERFVEIFLQSTDFFPIVERQNVAVKDDNGNTVGSIDEDGWGIFSSRTAIGGHRDFIKESTLPFFPQIHTFLDDPKGAPMYFNQKKILEKFARRNDQPL